MTRQRWLAVSRAINTTQTLRPRKRSPQTTARALIGLFLGGILLIPVSPVWSQSDAEMALQNARTAFAADDYESALKLAQQAAQTDSNNPDVHLLIGKSAYQLGQLNAALTAWRQVLKLAPDHVYARNMVSALEGRLTDTGLRLQLVQQLLDDGMTSAAISELKGLGSALALTERQRIDKLRLSAHIEIELANGELALRHVRELILRDPDAANSVNIRLLRARAQVASKGTLQAVGLAELKKISEDSPDSEAGRIAVLELLSDRLARGQNVVPELQEWIEQNSSIGAARRARQRLRLVVDQFIQASASLPLPRATADIKLNDHDRAALIAARGALKTFADAEAQTAIVTKLVTHFYTRYAEQKALSAARAALGELQQLELPAAAAQAVALAAKRIDEAEAGEKYARILQRLQMAAAEPAELAKWIEDHSAHVLVSTARRELLAAYLSAARRAAAPKPDSPLDDSFKSAVSVLNQLVAEPIDEKGLTSHVAQMLKYLHEQYTARQAFTAAIEGLELLRASKLAPANHRTVLLSLLATQHAAAMHELSTAVAAGLIKPGPLPTRLADATETVALINREFPASPAWSNQAQLAAEVSALSARLTWPSKVTERKPVQSWALELAIPVVAGSREAEPIAKARAVVDSVISELAAVPQPAARELATQSHQQLLAAVSSDRDIWPAVVLRHVDLLIQDAAAEFDRNVLSGDAAKNAKPTATQQSMIELLTQLVKAQPASAPAALQKLEAHLAKWITATHVGAVERLYTDFSNQLPAAQQRQVQLSLARLWFSEVRRTHQRVLATGFQVERQLDPLAQKALVQCYQLAGAMGPNDPLLTQVRQLRSQIIDHYLELDYEDVAETAMRVKGEPAMAELDEAAELELAFLKSRIANRLLDRQLKRHGGKDQLALTPEFNVAIGAFKAFIEAHPNSVRVPQAANGIFSVGQTFERHASWSVAAEIYADLETFAAATDALSQTTNVAVNFAERAAAARAGSLQTLASTNLKKSQSRQQADEPPPVELSGEFQDAIKAWEDVIGKYENRQIVQTAIGRITAISLEYAAINAWDVSESVYARLMALELPLRAPERLQYARAICQLGKVLPEHSRTVLQALVIAGPPRPRKSGGSGDDDSRPLMVAQNEELDELSESVSRVYETADSPVAAAVAENAPTPGIAGPGSGKKLDEMNQSGQAGRGGDPFGGGAGGFGDVGELGGTLEGADLSQFRQDSDAEVMAALQNQLSRQARQVAMLRDTETRRREPKPGEDGGQQSQQQSAEPDVAVLSEAELQRQAKVVESVYTELQKIRAQHPETSTAQQSRDEIFVVINHWRSLTEWDRAAELARRYLADNPRDIALPRIRQDVASDWLAWASQGVEDGQDLSNQEMLDEIGRRFDLAREELKGIIDAFPEETAVRHQAQWDIANSYLTQARVVAGSSQTLARGQYVRAAAELLQVADRFHDHPQIGSIPDMLWAIANELTSRGYHDEAVDVWNRLTIHFPTHPHADQSALRIAQTWQQLEQPLRAAESYLELNFARGGSDVELQNTILQIAVQLKNEKRWVESLHVLMTFVDSFPSHPSAGQALTMIGQIHQANEVWVDAIEAYGRVIDEFDSGDWSRESRWAIAECTINLSRWEEAIGAYAEFQKLYAEEPRIAEATRRIEVLKTLVRYQHIIDEEGQRKAFDAQYQIGSIVRTQLANPVKAIIEYRKVAANWPQSHLADDALFEIGKIYIELGETEAARKALVQAATKYPASPLADDALLLVGTTFVNEADSLAAVDRSKSKAIAKDIAQREAYRVVQDNRRRQIERNVGQIAELKRMGKQEEAAGKEAHFASQALQFDAVNTLVASNWAAQQEEMLSAAQLADRQDKINAALRKAVDSFQRAAGVAGADKADDALLRMAQIYDERLKDSEAAMATWEEIVKQYSGTTVAEDASWKIAHYYELHDQHAKAIDAYQSFLRNYRRSPRAGQAQAAIAENHEHLGQWVQAMDAYTNYLNNFPQGPQVKRAQEQISWIKTYRL